MKKIFLIFLLLSTSFWSHQSCAMQSYTMHAYAVQEKIISLGFTVHNTVREFGYWKSIQVVGFGLMGLLALDKFCSFFSHKTPSYKTPTPQTVNMQAVQVYIDKQKDNLYADKIKPLEDQLAALIRKNKKLTVYRLSNEDLEKIKTKVVVALQKKVEKKEKKLLQSQATYNEVLQMLNNVSTTPPLTPRTSMTAYDLMQQEDATTPRNLSDSDIIYKEDIDDLTLGLGGAKLGDSVTPLSDDVLSQKDAQQNSPRVEIIRETDKGKEKTT